MARKSPPAARLPAGCSVFKATRGHRPRPRRRPRNRVAGPAGWGIGFGHHDEDEDEDEGWFEDENEDDDEDDPLVPDAIRAHPRQPRACPSGRHTLCQSVVKHGRLC
jgi:hypothetical protein